VGKYKYSSGCRQLVSTADPVVWRWAVCGDVIESCVPHMTSSVRVLCVVTDRRIPSVECKATLSWRRFWRSLSDVERQRAVRSILSATVCLSVCLSHVHDYTSRYDVDSLTCTKKLTCGPLSLSLPRNVTKRSEI